ncbi:hypothetical protein OPT61_g1660 [Boeremia exigua]|uniref:Uncharacterized protein n=1 Tax=Boeremia exigua TaxID=749465 RepID=A0ACC2IPA7_9PLEO|nr:hypothetical protein OPT61_g1660 [Boeremia exigua]
MAPSAIDLTEASPQDFIHPDDLRTKFSSAMSVMYRNEVPLYGDLIRVVESVNAETLRESMDPKITAIRNGDIASERLHLERHGAIRLGTEQELQTIRRVFAIIGLFPVGYYDLSIAGLPMHATCFRPTSLSALERNPFRVFTTLLRPALLKDAEARDLATTLLSKRNIFSPELMKLLDATERQNNKLRSCDAEVFVQEAMKIFGWRPVAAAPKAVYQKLKEEHPILADIACFHTAHINHLTPRTLNIVAAQDQMKAEGLQIKERIEGPPFRRCPVLLRQTSFLALEESINFPGDGFLEKGHHRARFGEIEERGAAVTDKGRALYDELLYDAMKKISNSSLDMNASQKDNILADTFASFPDTWDELRRQGLAYFTFHPSASAKEATIPAAASLDDLVSRGIVLAEPITYEDFLPLSAAGIFQSNLSDSRKAKKCPIKALPDQVGLERALGCRVTDVNRAYAEAQERSLRKCAVQLGLAEGAFI